MKIVITARELEILRKAVYGLSSKEIAREMKLSPNEVDSCLKELLKNTQSREPMQAMQNLAKNGFQLSD